MIYELIGLTGSGKSFVAEKISREKDIPMIKTGSRAWRYFFAFLFSIEHPLFTVRIVRLTLDNTFSNKKVLKHKLFYILLNALAKEYILRHKKSDVIVDEGLLQYFPSIYEDFTDLEKLESDIDLPFFTERKVLLVTVEEEVRVGRMNDRGRFLRQQLPEDERNRYAKIFEHNFALIKGIFAKKFEITEIVNKDDDQ